MCKLFSFLIHLLLARVLVQAEIPSEDLKEEFSDGMTDSKRGNLSVGNVTDVFLIKEYGDDFDILHTEPRSKEELYRHAKYSEEMNLDVADDYNDSTSPEVSEGIEQKDNKKVGGSEQGDNEKGGGNKQEDTKLVIESYSPDSKEGEKTLSVKLKNPIVLKGTHSSKQGLEGSFLIHGSLFHIIEEQAKTNEQKVCISNLNELYTCIMCSNVTMVKHRYISCYSLLPSRVKEAVKRCVGVVFSLNMEKGYDDKDIFAIACYRIKNIKEVVKCTADILLDLPKRQFAHEERDLAQYSHCLYTINSDFCCPTQTEKLRKKTQS